MNWVQLVTNLSTIALASNPKTAAIAPYIGPAVAEAEAMRGTKGEPISGTAKLGHAVNMVKLSLQATNAAKPGTLNLDVADQVIANAISASVDAANVYKRAHLIVN